MKGNCATTPYILYHSKQQWFFERVYITRLSRFQKEYENPFWIYLNQAASKNKKIYPSANRRKRQTKWIFYFVLWEFCFCDQNSNCLLYINLFFSQLRWRQDRWSGSSVSLDMNLLRRKEINIQNVRRQNNCTKAAIDLIQNKKIDVDFMATH